MPEHSEAFEDGRYARQLGEALSNNPHEAGSAKSNDWIEGFNYRAPALAIERVTMMTKPGEAPPYGLMGYVIPADGTIYTLTRQHFHGAVTAMLFPEAAEKHGIGVPCGEPEDVNVFRFQEFEHDSRDLEVIRIAISSFTGTTHFSKGDKPATAAQIIAVQACAKALGYSGRDKINTERGDIKLAEVIERLRQSDVFEPDSEDV